MMTSSYGTIFRVTGHLCGEFTGPDDFPAQRPVTRSFDVFFYMRLNKRLSNNRETGDLRRHHGHYDVNVIYWCLVKPYGIGFLMLVQAMVCTESSHYLLIATWGQIKNKFGWNSDKTTRVFIQWNVFEDFVHKLATTLVRFQLCRSIITFSYISLFECWYPADKIETTYWQIRIAFFMDTMPSLW